jgi:hypothetical protein
VRFFGLLVAISIGASLVGALVVLPAIVLITRPRFLEPKPTVPSPEGESLPAASERPMAT